MDNQQNTDNKEITNIVWLKILCTFTFIGAGLGVLSFGSIALFFDYFNQNLTLIPDEKNRELIKLMLTAGRTYFLFLAILNAITFVGALYLWKLRKIGFHIYTLSQLLILLLPFAIQSSIPANEIAILTSFLFIFGYYNFLKFMK